MKLSVALCTFNGQTHLAEQLRSIETQARQPEELIVCDDGSQDDTTRLLERFAKRSPFPVCLHRNEKPLGTTANFAKALSLCRGDVIVTCDQDDRWRADKLSVLEACFRDNPSALLAFSDLALITAEGQPSGETQWQRLGFGRSRQAAFNNGGAFPLLLRFNVVTGAAMAFRASLLKHVLPIPSPFLHDEWIGLVAAATGNLVAVNEALVDYRQHDRQRVGAPPKGLFAQFADARRQMTRSYFAQMVERTLLLRERLSTGEVPLRDPAYPQRIEAKLTHARARLAMRGTVYSRWPRALREALYGRYQRFGHGSKSLLQDLFL